MEGGPGRATPRRLKLVAKWHLERESNRQGARLEFEVARPGPPLRHGDPGIILLPLALSPTVGLRCALRACARSLDEDVPESVRNAEKGLGLRRLFAEHLC